MTILEFIQIGSVFFGTLIAAPLIVSKKYNKRLIGLIAVAAGSLLAMIVQLNAGLYYFLFASAFWLLNSAHAIRKMVRKNKSYVNLKNL
ncbi:hypothetical protein OAU21_01920 [Gammaproteobacteria bacterium]|nr:hypothetical protein [Gammaproteobacteria bacterium]